MGTLNTGNNARAGALEIQGNLRKVCYSRYIYYIKLVNIKMLDHICTYIIRYRYIDAQKDRCRNKYIEQLISYDYD